MRPHGNLWQFKLVATVVASIPTTVTGAATKTAPKFENTRKYDFNFSKFICSSSSSSPLSNSKTKAKRKWRKNRTNDTRSKQCVHVCGCVRWKCVFDYSSDVRAKGAPFSGIDFRLNKMKKKIENEFGACEIHLFVSIEKEISRTEKLLFGRSCVTRPTNRRTNVSHRLKIENCFGPTSVTIYLQKWNFRFATTVFPNLNSPLLFFLFLLRLFVPIASIGKFVLWKFSLRPTGQTERNEREMSFMNAQTQRNNKWLFNVLQQFM